MSDSITTKKLLGLKKNVWLKPYSTYKIGGRAKYFFVAHSKSEVIEAVEFAKKNKIKYFVLGGGSNVLFPDEGFNGLVIKIDISLLETKGNIIFAGAGIPLSSLVSLSAQKKLSGLEWAAGIYGTLGGAIYGNAGAFGEDIGGLISNVEVWNIEDGVIQNLSQKECYFGYRDSIFKKQKKYVILTAKLSLRRGKPIQIRKRIKNYLKTRQEHQPLSCASAGSIFKNPKGDYAGKIIEDCGLKGKKIGNIEISRKHANFFVNLGKGKARDVKKLINLVKKEAKKKFNITLEEEIILV
ncbi:MAG TPA: UDP-N-acetylmuramate dehydrogenase [Candidatus Pacearchaeota archaeon]|nr:UDP-N-acetylmuramate dehydrogenase [Candidatus Pacearchaeota archaeon]